MGNNNNYDQTNSSTNLKHAPQLLPSWGQKKSVGSQKSSWSQKSWGQKSWSQKSWSQNSPWSQTSSRGLQNQRNHPTGTSGKHNHQRNHPTGTSAKQNQQDQQN